MGNILRRVFRWAVFKVGDMRWEGWRFTPFVIGCNPKHVLIRGDEILKAAAIVEPGDVVIARKDGYFSNVGIGGCFIHAAIYIGDGECIEALSDDQGGVTMSSIVDVLHADVAAILRPKLSTDERLAATMMAKKIVGAKYDFLFDFNVEEELRQIEKNPELAKKMRFACTEVVLFAYLKHKEDLKLWVVPTDGLLTKALRFLGLMIGDDALTADGIGVSEMDVVWASRSCTQENLLKRKGSEGLRVKLRKFMELVR